MYLVDFYGFHIPFMHPMDVIFELEMSRYSRYRSRLLKLCEKILYRVSLDPRRLYLVKLKRHHTGPQKVAEEGKSPYFRDI